MRSLRPRKSIRRKVSYRDPISHGSLKGCFFGYFSCSSVFLCCAHYSSVPSVCQAVFFLAHGPFSVPETCSAASRNTGHGLPRGKVDTRQGGRMRGGKRYRCSESMAPPTRREAAPRREHSQNFSLIFSPPRRRTSSTFSPRACRSNARSVPAA